MRTPMFSNNDVPDKILFYKFELQIYTRQQTRACLFSNTQRYFDMRIDTFPVLAVYDHDPVEW